MAFSLRVFIAMALLLTAPMASRGQDQCDFPTENDVKEVYITLSTTAGSEGGSDVAVNVTQMHFTCLARVALNKYTRAAVVINFTTNENPNPQMQQYQLQCFPGNAWGANPSGSFDPNVTSALFNLETRDQCSACLGASDSPNYDAASNCLPCAPECLAMGGGFCTGASADNCCPYFGKGGVCEDDCTTIEPNFGPNADFECVCSINKSTCGSGSPSTENCSCNCTGSGYSGSTCNVDIDECMQNLSACVDNATCTNIPGGYVCVCPPGYTGATCSVNIDECASQPCANGATCHDGIDAYACDCAEGYSGNNCQDDIDDCEGDPCENDGSCIDGVATYSCICPVGYTGSKCEEDIDECLSQPCANGGTCDHGVGTFSCQCVGNWRGQTCEECFVENCLSPVCDGVRTSCGGCSSRYSLVNGAMCVSCPISNCASCSRDSICNQCVDGYGLVADDMCSLLPPEPLLSGGEIVGLSIGLLVLGLVILIVMAATLLFLKKKNWYKPSKNDSGKEDKNVILSKISTI